MGEHNCRVCGLYIDNKPWGEDGNCPTYEICPCCGVEFGNEDYTTKSTREFRRKWIEEGAKWNDLKEKPKDWNLEKQMRDVPNIYK